MCTELCQREVKIAYSVMNAELCQKNTASDEGLARRPTSFFKKQFQVHCVEDDSGKVKLFCHFYFRCFITIEFN